MKYLQNNKILKYCVCIICSYLAVYAFSYILKLEKNESELFSMLEYGYSWLMVLIFAFGVYVIDKFIQIDNKKIQICSLLSGLFLSLVSVWGAYSLFLNNIFISGGKSVLQIFLIIGMTLIIGPSIGWIFTLMDKFGTWYQEKKEKVEYSKKNNLFYFLIVWIIIFVCYLPAFLAWWPGNFIYDAKYQLSEVVHNAYKTHHPLLHTWLMGKAYNIGIEWGSASKGFQLYTLLQMLILSSSFSYCVLYLRKKGTPKLIRVLAILWFALFPMNSIFSITATKDVLFAAFFLYTVIFLCRFFYDKEKFRWYTYFGLIIFGVMSTLFRNNAIYAIGVFGIIGIVVVKGWMEKGKVTLIFLAIYLLTTLSNQLLADGLNAYPGFKNRESLSVPLQGLARVACYRGDELYEYEYNEICMYIRAEDIPNYSPAIADPIKNNANEELLENNKINFLKLWLKIGMQYPDEYIESIVFNTMGFWYLFPMKDYTTMNLSIHHTLIGTEQEIEKVCYCDWAEKLYGDIFFGANYKYIPLLSESFRIAPYIWFMIFIFIWSVIKIDKKTIFIMLLPLLYFGTCLLGPVSAVRYVYCLIVCCPLWFAFIGQIKLKDEIQC